MLKSQKSSAEETTKPKTKKIRGKIVKYIPHKMYGFLSDGEVVSFFHLSQFKSAPPEPIVGECVDYFLQKPKAGKSYCTEVVRLVKPLRLNGIVIHFDSTKGYGRIEAEDGSHYFLHRSEMTDGRHPSKGSEVLFYRGVLKGENRAVYIYLKEQGNE